jgi:hypothetical protein
MTFTRGAGKEKFPHVGIFDIGAQLNWSLDAWCDNFRRMDMPFNIL